MDIAICIDRLGLNKNSYRLTQSVPPHHITEWSGPDPQPTQAELETAWAEWQAEQDATQYQRDRASEYPSIDALVVALWESVVEERLASALELQAKRQEIKDKYPKE